MAPKTGRAVIQVRCRYLVRPAGPAGVPPDRDIWIAEPVVRGYQFHGGRTLGALGNTEADAERGFMEMVRAWNRTALGPEYEVLFHRER